ncbi:MAG: carboxymuconolactone decarboxylase family protein [Candidatus Yonathbacteria bacterium]|nr:carboxymuconolactone decarboxylase family protein [Candidatus Yonathbacteria bacterium]NTW47807.1 carboxymuconolactone decarboxylase family protein [Candidatus Yonathbacteria bacterium]
MTVITQVHIIEDTEAVGVATPVFQEFIDTRGSVPEWARVMAHRPEILATFYALFKATMGPGLVEQDNKWKIAYKVSKLNGCAYCVGVTEAMMKKLGVSDEDMRLVDTDIAQMSPDEQIAVRYAEAVTKNALEVPEEIYTELNVHYNDGQIVELTAAIGLFNYINRFNDALGVMPR